MYTKSLYLLMVVITVTLCDSDQNDDTPDENADNKMCQLEKDIMSLKAQIAAQDATIARQSVRIVETSLNNYKLDKDVSSMNEKLLKQQHDLELLEKANDTPTNGNKELHSCPNGYIQHERSCYRIHHDVLSWPEAYTFCKAFGSHLAIENTVEEHVFLMQKALEVQGSYTGTAYWIAASDAENEGDWYWASTEQSFNMRWGPRQPNNGVISNCACLWKNFKYEIADEPCRNTYNFICEIELADE